MLPLVPLAISSLIGLAFLKVKKSDPNKGVFTPARQVIFQQAIDNCRDPVRLRALAKAYRGEGLTAQADLLEKRAAIRETPPAVAAAHREVFKKAINHTNPEVVLNVASAFDTQGANGAAMNLRKYANGLIEAQRQPTVVPTVKPTLPAIPATPASFESAQQAIAAAAAVPVAG